MRLNSRMGMSASDQNGLAADVARDLDVPLDHARAFLARHSLVRRPQLEHGRSLPHCWHLPAAARLARTRWMGVPARGTGRNRPCASRGRCQTGSIGAGGRRAGMTVRMVSMRIGVQRASQHVSRDRRTRLPARRRRKRREHRR